MINKDKQHFISYNPLKPSILSAYNKQVNTTRLNLF